MSPTAASTFRNCALQYYYRYVLGVRTRPTPETLVGQAAHLVCERIFTLPRPHRTPEAAEAMVPAAVAEVLRSSGGAPDGVDEATMVGRVGDLVRAWFGLERPWNFDPVATERRVAHPLEGTGMRLVGVIDRLDRLEGPGGERWYITDYKTGRIPDPRYEHKAFEAMLVYAWLVAATGPVVPRVLRLVYLTGAVLRREITAADAEGAVERIRAVARAVLGALESDRWRPSPGPLCGWCDFRAWCPAQGGPGVVGPDGRPLPGPAR